MADTVRTLLMPRLELEGIGRVDTPFGPALVWGSRRPGAQRSSEDSVLVRFDESSLVLVVADGAGGHALGGEASEAAVRAIAAELENDPKAPIHARLVRAREHAAEAVAALGHEAITTLAIALVHEKKLTTWHAGDTTVLLTGQRGRRKLRTVDHTPPGIQVGSGDLSLNEARAHGDRHLLVNALGSGEVRWETTGPVPIGARDTLVLATDGLFDNLSDDEVVDCVRKGSFEDGVFRLIEGNARRMYERDGEWPGKPDDVAIVAYRTL